MVSNRPADFYSRVNIDGEEFPLQGPIDNDNVIDPNWTFVKEIDYAAKKSVPVRISIWDNDGGLNFNDDHIVDHVQLSHAFLLNILVKIEEKYTS